MASPESTGQARTVSEAEFFRQIILDSSNAADVQIYQLMKTEAIAGLQRMSQASGENNVSEVAFRAEVLQIYQDAHTSTKPIYDRGATVVNGVMTDNWVIRWMLWEAMHQPNGR